MGKRIKVFRTRDRMRKKFLFGFILLFSMTAFHSGSYNYAVQDKGYFQLYIEASYHRDQGSKEDNEKAIQLFHKVIELKSEFAPSYIGLANCYINNVNDRWDEKLEWLDKAEDLLEKANALSPGRLSYYYTLITTYLAKYIVFDQDTRGLAINTAEEALRKYQYLPQIISIAGYCFFLKFGETGNKDAFKRALELKERAYQRNPFGKGNMMLTELLLLNKDFKRAIKVCNELRNIEPPAVVDSRIGQLHYYSGDLDKSELLLRQITTPLEFSILAKEYLGMIAAQKNDKDSAYLILQDLYTLPFESLGSGLRKASILMGMGLEEQGFEELDAFFDTPYTQKTKYLYKRYIDLDRNFKKFRKKIRRRYYEPKTKN